MAICITNYKLIVTFGDKTQKVVPVQASHQLKLPSDAHLTVIETATGKPPAKLRSNRQGNALVLELEGEGELTQVVDFYDSFVQLTPEMPLTPATQQVLAAELAAAANAAACLPVSSVASDAPALSPLMSGLAWGGGAVLVAKALSSAEPISKVVARVVGGPVLAGNDLEATIYKADGVTVLGKGSIGADGTVNVSIGNYKGVVVVKVQNNGGPTDTDGTPDYMDEATGRGKDFGDAVIYSAGVLVQEGSTIYLNVNSLTALAHHMASQAVGAGNSLDVTTVNNTNEAIAEAFGLDDLSGGDIATTVDQSGVVTGQSANTYGQILAALSGADRNNGGDIQQTLDDLAAGIVISGATATLGQVALDLLIEGAQIADPNNTLNLVDKVSDATAITSASVSIDAVGSDNIVNLSELTSGTTISGTCAAGAVVSLTLGGNERSVTVDGTSWTYALSTEDTEAMQQGADTLRVTTTLNGVSTSASRGIYIDTQAPVAPTVEALPCNDTSPTLTGTAVLGVGETLSITVNGATYAVTPDSSTGQWRLDLGTVAPTSGTLGVLVDGQIYPVVATVTDTAGNQTVDATSNELRIDTTAPTLTIHAVSGGYINNAEAASALTLSGTSNAEDGQVVTITLGGRTYTALVASGVWSATVPSADLQALSQGTVTFTANVTDAAGNNATQATQSFVYDTVAPAAPAAPTAYTDDAGAIQNADSTATVTDDTQPGIRVGANLTDTPKLYVNGTLTAATYNASTGTLTPDSTLPDGAYFLTYSLTDAAGNESAQSAALALTIDTTAPATPAAPLAYTDNVGTAQNLASTAAFTDDTQPGIRISTNLTDTPKLYVNGVFTEATYTANTGTLTPNSALPEGAKLLTYSLTDAAGNESAQSEALSITVDTTAPSTPAVAPDLPGNSDTGTTNSDNNTSNNRPGLQVGAPLPSGVTQIDLLVNGQVVSALYDSQTGLLQPATALADGTHTLSYRYTDAAGNQSSVSPTLSLTIDTTAPAQPSAAADLVASSDSGTSATDNTTRNTRPELQVGALPAGASGVELLVNGQPVQATYNSGVLQPDSALPDGTHAITYRFIDTAGNAGTPSAPLSVTIDATAPINVAITSTSAGSIAGTYEAGTVPTLTIAGQPTAIAITANPNGTWSYAPDTNELALLRVVGAKELVLTATDVAGNTARDNRTVTADDFNGPYIKEYIPFDGGVLANNPNGANPPASATLNVVFSKDVVKGTGTIQLFEFGNPTAVATLDVTSSAVQIESGRDVFITLPSLTLNSQYYATFAAGTFVDLSGESYVGRTQTVVAGYDFTAVAASIAPNFVAGDDLINITENSADVLISGKVVSSSAILQAINPADLTVAVTALSGQPAVTAITPTYNNATGEFSFTVNADAWREGNYRYTVTLAGSTGAAAGISASYQFDDLGVDLTAPTTTASVQGAQDNAGAITGDLWATSTTATSDDTSPTLSGTLGAVLTGDARVVVYRQDVTGTPGALVRLTSSEGLKPADTTWSLTDSGLVNGRTYTYTAYVEDAAGNRSAAGTVKTLTIDTTAPLAGVSAASLSADTGNSATDWLTNVASQSINGTLGMALVSGEKLLGSLNGGVAWQDLTSLVSGTAFTWSGITLQPGQGSIRFKVTDLAGNAGPVASYTPELDTTAPSAPASAPDLPVAADTGTSDTDDNTSTNRPALLVGALPADAVRVDLLVNNTVVTATYDSQTGLLQPNADLPDGTHAVRYRYTDAAGNESATSPVLSLTVDTMAPTGVSGADISDDTGTLATDFITNAAVQTITATLGATLGTDEKVFGSVDNGTTWTDITGQVTGSAVNWTGATLAGASNIQLQVRDAAGNVGTTATQAYTLDTTLPTTTIGTVRISADTGTLATDFITKTAAQTVTATLSAALGAGEEVFGSVDDGATWTHITNQVAGTTLRWNNATLAGASSIKLQVRDAAGNAAPTVTQAYTLDTTPPTTTVSGIDISTDDGTSATDFITKTAAQTITATLSAPLATGERLFGSVNGGSTWVDIFDKVSGTSVNWTGATLAGTSSIQLQVRDAAGNASASVVQQYVLENPLPPGQIYLSNLAQGVGGFVINGQSGGDLSGFSVSSAGDVNGDGLDDLLVGAKGSDPSGLNKAGRSYVVFGKTSTNSVDLNAVAGGTGGFVINGQSAENQSGTSVSNLGDVNGDGLADILVGSISLNRVTNTWDAPAYVVFGQDSTNPVNLADVSAGSGGFVINGRTGSIASYVSNTNLADISGAGDVNGDGLADIILGTAYAINSTSYVVYGKSSGDAVQLGNITDQSQGFVISESAYSGSGFSVSNAGDVNGDGYADVIVGAPYSNASIYHSGKSYVVFGGSTNANVNLNQISNGTSSNGFVINGGQTSALSGYVVSGAGDVNGDGLADLVVSAPIANLASIDPRTGQPKQGKVYVIFGKTSAGSVSLNNVENGNGGFLIESFWERNGGTVSTAGDINGDGLADLILGRKESSGTLERTYVVYGKTSSTKVSLANLNPSTGSDGFAIYSVTDNHVSSAGDVNGDGLDDLIVGVSIELGTAGRSYVIFGATSNSAFSQSAVDWLGTTGDDTYAATAPGQTLVGNQGNDTISAYGASVLYGGAGHDTIVIDQAMITALATAGTASGVLARVDGGNGTDTVKLVGTGLTLDLTTIANQAASGPDGGSRIDSVEIFDVTGSGNNTLRLNHFDVLELGRDSLLQTSGRQQMVVKGNVGDVVDLADGAGTAGWTQAAAVTLNSASYDVWNHNTSLATLYVSQGLQVL